MIIAFFGPDGSGKTTHIRLLAGYLRYRGYKVKVRWLSSHHGLAWLLNRLITSFGIYVLRPSPLVNSPVKYIPAQVIGKNKLLRFVLSISELISLTAHLAFIYLLSKFGYVVIVERFLPSTLADFIYSNYIRIRKHPDLLSKIMLSSIIGFMLRIPAIYIYLEANYNTICRRRSTSTEPWDYLALQKVVYDMLVQTMIRKQSLHLRTDNTSTKSNQAKIRYFVIKHFEKGKS